MSPFGAAATVQVQTTVSRDEVPSSQLERVVKFDTARWLPSLLSDLRSLELSGANFPGIGDFRVSHGTADRVRQLLTVISGVQIPEPRLSPFSGGGVALVCSGGNKELTFTAYPDDRDFIFSITNENDELTEDGVITLEQTGRLGALVTAFLAQ